MPNFKDIEREVARYYDGKISEHGPTSQGVDWNGRESQEIRFTQTLKVIQGDSGSVLDIGCGYGALYDFMQKNGYSGFSYTGIDISEQMISEAERLHKGQNGFKLLDSIEKAEAHDYVTASGLFNVMQESSSSQWSHYCTAMLDKFNEYSKKGFSFNMLTKYSDKEFMKDYLYYADPLYFFDYCKSNYSKNVALLHDYNLYEFTLIVRK